MRRPLVLLALAAALPAAAAAQSFAPTTGFAPFDPGPPSLQLQGDVRPGQYLSAVGRRAIAMGTEDGAFELWSWPYKWMHDFRLSFRVPKYTQPIAGKDVARHVSVSPRGVTITYSYETFTVKQTVFVPLDLPAVVMLLEVDAIRPMEIIASFTPDVHLAWPASLGGQYIAWSQGAKAFVFSEPRRKVNAFVGSPAVTQASDVPAHQLTAAPPEFTIGVGSASERYTEPRLGEPPGGNVNIHVKSIPIIMAGGEMPRDSALAMYRHLLEPGVIESEMRARARHATSVAEWLMMPWGLQNKLGQALEWAKVNLDESMVCNPDLGCGLVAGYGLAGGASDRPGFGWFFGGDASINSFAMTAAGQGDLVREGVLEFFAKYQRADGKITHEISQGAGKIDWFGAYPYAFYHGDTTPFWILAFGDYFKQSADTATVRKLWPKVKKAYEWSRKCDTDGDGLMENTCAGAGALEVGDLQEGIVSDVYLNGVWAASLEPFARMADVMGEATLAAEARAERVRAMAALESRLWIPAKGQYAFAVLEKGKINETMTAWPATAMAFDVFDKEKGRLMAERLARSDMMTDWGARPLSTTSPLFDPLHYNNGAVWPFVTGWVALAQFRYGNPHAGWQALRAIANTTFAESRGRNPEVISGRVYKPLDTAVPQQFFATSMIITPLVRGLFGIDADAPAHHLTVAPWLVAGHDILELEQMAFGDNALRISAVTGDRDVTLTVSRGRKRLHEGPLDVRFAPSNGTRAAEGTIKDGESSIRLTVPRRRGWDVYLEERAARIGERSSAPRVVSAREVNGEYHLGIEGLAGDTVHAYIVTPRGMPQGGDGVRVLSRRFYPFEMHVDSKVEARLRALGAREVDIELPREGADADGYVRRLLVFRAR